MSRPLRNCLHDCSSTINVNVFCKPEPIVLAFEQDGISFRWFPVSIMKNIRRHAILTVVICFGFAGTLWSATPDDLKFELFLVGEVHGFHAGESIPLEMAFSSQTDKK